MRGSLTVVHLWNAIKRQTAELWAARLPFSAPDAGRALTPFIPYIPGKITECWLVEAEGILFLTMGVSLVSIGFITDPVWLKVASHRSVLFEIRWWANIPSNIFPWVRDSGKNFESRHEINRWLPSGPWQFVQWNVRGAKRGAKISFIYPPRVLNYVRHVKLFNFPIFSHPYSFTFICIYLYLHLHTFIIISIQLSSSTLIYVHVPASSIIYLYSHSFTFIYPHVRSFTFIYRRLGSFTFIYSHLRLSTFIYLHLRSFTFTHSLTFICVHLYLHLCSFTFIFVHLRSFTFICLHLPSFTFIYLTCLCESWEKVGLWNSSSKKHKSER